MILRRRKFPTGGTAHEPKGMIRCDSEADSIVWMKEDKISFMEKSGLLTALKQNLFQSCFIMRTGAWGN